MKSGAMDGLAFLRGLKTIYFGLREKNGRMDKVGNAFGAFTLIPLSYKTKFAAFSNDELESIYSEIDV